MSPKKKAKRSFMIARLTAVILFILSSLLLIVKQIYFGLFFLVGMLVYTIWNLNRVEKLLDKVDD